MKRWKVWLGVTVIFVSGLVIGSLGTGVVITIGIKKMIQRVTAGDTAVAARMVMMKMRHELRLSRDQRRRILPIINRAVVRIRKLHFTLRPQMEREVARAVAEINPYLTPEQRRKLTQRLNYMKSKWQPPRP
ncbi:MAG: hypothetical protein KJ621_06800 [Proteobacteria bacterium]|nr:hypothetical protein [Pseudomonadota bacterium]MBU1741688.1 hypothetical protein [Pseudomonadota bacterium]